jgi:hypothetical protein
MVRTAATSRRRGPVEATRANPRRSARQPKAKEPSPTPAPVSKAKKAPKAVASTSKKPTQAPRKRQKKEDPPASPEEPVQTEEEAAALARAKVAWAKTKGRRGHLKMVVEMPFDLLLEVFGFLQPADLLHLAMTTKAMRSLVMDKTLALPLWKAVCLPRRRSQSGRGADVAVTLRLLTVSSPNRRLALRALVCLSGLTSSTLAPATYVSSSKSPLPPVPHWIL